MAREKTINKGQKPDWNVGALDRKTEMRGIVGVAWNKPDGTISVKLNICIVLDTTRQDLLITLFPTNRPPPQNDAPETSSGEEPF